MNMLVSVVKLEALKTGLLDNALLEFSLAQPSWVMSHYTMRAHEAESNGECFCTL